MPRAKREKPDPHIVFVDTSTIFYEDKGPPVDPAFDSFWREYSAEFDLELRVPDVVKGEILFQHTTKAKSSLQNANEHIGKVSHVTGKTYKHRVSDSRIAREVSAKIENWLGIVSAKVLPTPTNVISWDQVIDAAIWRTPPFSDGKAEKGFRDAMIMQTIINSCVSEKSNKQIVFLCRDENLRTTLDRALKSDDRYVSFEYINEFKSYLDLKNEELESKFIRKITRRANNKFFMPGDKTCLWYRENLSSRLKQDYAEYFDNPNLSKPPTEFFPTSGLLYSVQDWESGQDGRFWVGASTFVEKAESGDYMWMNVVTYVEEFSRGVEGVPSLLVEPNRTLILPFHVKWISRVTSDGRFLTTELSTIELEGNEFREPSGEERQRWKLIAE